MISYYFKYSIYFLFSFLLNFAVAVKEVRKMIFQDGGFIPETEL